MMKFLAAIALPLYALDQLTKWWVVEHFTPYDEPQPVIDHYFYLCRWHNTGAAFSIGSGNNWFFVVLSVVTLAGLLVFYARGVFRDLLSRVGVGLLIAGILGNLTDRHVGRVTRCPVAQFDHAVGEALAHHHDGGDADELGVVELHTGRVTTSVIEEHAHT